MAYEALKHYSQRNLAFHFVSNVDGIDFVEATRGLDPRDAFYCVLQNFHHAGDHDQRGERARLAAEGIGRGRESCGKTFCGCFDQCREGVRVRN